MYQVQYTIPYEGTEIVDFMLLEEALRWIYKHQFSLDSVNLLKVEDLDIYTLMQGWKKKHLD
jgi:hypothetical protein